MGKVKERVLELEESIEYHSDLYYNSEPEISDADFDALVDELRKLHPQSPILKKVGAKSISVWPKVAHEQHMGSLLKCNEHAEVVDWHLKSSEGHPDFCWSEKLDGSSISLTYVNGEFTQAVTRGDGITGDDITPNVLKMQGLVKQLIGSPSGTLFVRAEIIMPKKTFDEKYSEKAANPRNAAAGIARRLDGEGCTDLHVVAFNVEGGDFRSQSLKFQWLRQKGFKVPNGGYCTTDEFVSLVDDYIKSDREACAYEIDGLVLWVESIEQQERLGIVSGRPRAARAYKFPPIEKTTKLLRVEWNTGRTGIIAPTGIVAPINIGGVVISRVTLNNCSEIERLGVQIGSEVVLRRANDVIPQLASAKAGDQDIGIPITCPTCGSPTERQSVHVVCTNKESCSAQAAQYIQFFLRVLDVKGFGPAIIENFIAAGIRSPIELFNLTESDLSEMCGSDKMGKKLFKEFGQKASNGLTIPMFMEILGITGVGEHVGKLAMGAGFDTVEKLQAMTYEQLLSIQGIGPDLARKTIDGIRERHELIAGLLKFISIEEPKVIQATGTKCNGWLVCFTGFRDGDMEQEIYKQGGKVAASMNKQVTHLIAKDASGSSSKLQKARERGVKVLSKAEFEGLLA